MKIYLANTQGFCAGVSFAIAIVEKALKKYGTPLYIYHEIVHNTYVVNNFRKQGIIFVEDIKKVPSGSHIIFSAHGVPPSGFEEAKKLNLKIIDATCPLVKKIHHKAIKYSKNKYPTILIGHKGHQELIGTSGYISPDLLHIVENINDVENLQIPSDQTVTYLTQTTLSTDDTKAMIDKIKQTFSSTISPESSDICYATQNRQNAVKELSSICDLILICGSSNSSNSNRLRETGEKYGVDSYIIDNVNEINFSIFDKKQAIGISSGASVPRIIVDEVVEYIKQKFENVCVENFGESEKNIVFQVPNV